MCCCCVHCLVQVVSEPAYSDIMAELLSTSEGQELYLRDPACFNIPTGEAAGGAAECVSKLQLARVAC